MPEPKKDAKILGMPRTTGIIVIGLGALVVGYFLISHFSGKSSGSSGSGSGGGGGRPAYAGGGQIIVDIIKGHHGHKGKKPPPPKPPKQK